MGRESMEARKAEDQKQEGNELGGGRNELGGFGIFDFRFSIYNVQFWRGIERGVWLGWGLGPGRL